MDVCLAERTAERARERTVRGQLAGHPLVHFVAVESSHDLHWWKKKGKKVQGCAVIEIDVFSPVVCATTKLA